MYTLHNLFWPTLLGDFSIYPFENSHVKHFKRHELTELRFIFKHLYAGTQMLVDIKSAVSCQLSIEFDDQH